MCTFVEESGERKIHEGLLMRKRIHEQVLVQVLVNEPELIGKSGSLVCPADTGARERG